MPGEQGSGEQGSDVEHQGAGEQGSGEQRSEEHCSDDQSNRGTLFRNIIWPVPNYHEIHSFYSKSNMNDNMTTSIML